MRPSRVTLDGLLFALITIINLQRTDQWRGPGTTPNLEDIVIGRCYDYIETVNPSVGKKNCTAIWEAFQGAFISKDPCSVFPSDYERYINLTLHDIPMNKSLFWENNKQLVHRLSDRGKRYMALGDTLMGWLADNLHFCGSSSNSGFDYNSCPTSSECESNAQESFWRSASVTYAKHSSGEIQIMLNGSTPGGGFPMPSFLSDFEIPNFQRDKVSRINIWVMDEINGVNVDSCGENSTARLQSVLSHRGFPYDCYDNYRAVRILQCVDFPGNPECTTNSGSGFTSVWITMIPVWFTIMNNYGNMND
ncbi:ADP-ribosyl cyclase/cyclic ADP-ribose hydrolase 2-like isoform X1 [Engystomops pustulosus]|uniref:ADP-ribosyl cyclase/cyclic ADP-ribose hydrolase 2-like isoform X1 n=1 Tax=Engystomops pustulosus TaxID=76066 RepID=UPI003AFAAACA